MNKLQQQLHRWFYRNWTSYKPDKERWESAKIGHPPNRTLTTYHKHQPLLSNLIYLHQSHILPSFISHQNSPMIFHHHLYPPTVFIFRTQQHGSSAFLVLNSRQRTLIPFPSLPNPTQPLSSTKPYNPPSNKPKKSHQILARTHPTLSQNIPITFPTPPKKEIISITSTPTPTPTLHYIIAYSKINPNPPPSATHKNQVPGISIAHIVS